MAASGYDFNQFYDDNFLDSGLSHVYTSNPSVLVEACPLCHCSKRPIYCKWCVKAENFPHSRDETASATALDLNGILRFLDFFILL